MRKLIWVCRFFYLGLMLLLFFVLDYYHFLILNITLAYIPFEIAVFLYRKKRNPWIFWLISIAWLIFFPNAFYLVTDFFHLRQIRIYDYYGILRKDSFLWQSFSVMAGSIFFGLFVGNLSLQFFLDAARDQMKKNWTAVILPIVLLLSSYGIYLGRFERLHTVYLFTQPLETLNKILHVSLFQLEFICYMFLLQLAVYLMFRFFPKRS
ncbi:hypothetical protein MFLO_07222 [Listeria floridensis FSL S10-1187]|uniref:DUF1361 domain-containing protein n=1 Tax=Listeria floridensis FSL S10-1187 TaxID=1265817 RepID=A0ABP3B0U6_9LIST|nr:DUF1361 domain-containing protein [Listeria floridensis]EUJ32200.1 hypothetical protein MFLO_07222 [Listeria floridensis FSL S10-1187]